MQGSPNLNNRNFTIMRMNCGISLRRIPKKKPDASGFFLMVVEITYATFYRLAH